MHLLFSEFKKSTAQDWKNQLTKDLKGEAFESLIWKNENGFDVQPFYTQEDNQQVYEPAFTHSDWHIGVHRNIVNVKELNAQLLKDLNSGASSISIPCHSVDLDGALKDVQLNYIHSTFIVNKTTSVALHDYLKTHYNLSELNCALIPEKFTNQNDLNDWQAVVSLFKDYKNICTIGVNNLAFHNQNCLAYYEVALALSMLNEHLQYIKPGTEPTKLVIKTGVNSDYFLQIAKLRAIRRLWNILKTEYNLKSDLYLIVETSLTNKAISDSYNNLLRTTVESMAAVAGGCNELIVNTFDVLFATNKNLAERMAINQQLILKEESYLDKMADIACGSYYIEHITDAIATKALETFKRFEKEGGYFKCIEKNIFTNDIARQANQQSEWVETQKQISVGVNKFKNEKENIHLSAQVISELKHLPIQNPVLTYELEHYFK